MAINEACKFEIKEEVDKAILENRVSQAEALRGMQRFYKAIGLEVKFSTLKSKYHRASGSVANATKKSNNGKKSVTYESGKNSTTNPPAKRGGKRKSAGRPKVDKSRIISTDFKGAFNILFREIEKAKSGNWEGTTQEAALHHVKILYNLVTL